METLDEPPSPLYLLTGLIFGLTGPGTATLDMAAVITEVAIILLGILLGGLYSGSEVAYFSIAKQMHLLEPDQEKGGVDSLTLKMLSKPRRLLATILIGNTVANVVVSVMAASLTGRFVSLLAVPEVVVYAVEIMVISFGILILSEIAPKVFAIHNPLKTSRRLSRFTYAHFVLLAPLTRIISDSALILERLVPKPSTRMTTQDLKVMAEAGEREGSLKEDEREIIENVIEFSTITAREIMTSRVDMVAVAVDQTLEEVLAIIRDKGLSRMPLYENDLDHILGVLYTKDVLPFLHSGAETRTVNWKSIARKPLFIPATKKLDALLQDFQAEKTHMAIVVDEYGGTEGIITMDDLLEEIVGEFGDEFDDHEEKLFNELRNGVYVCDARMDLDEVEELLGLQLTGEEDEFETVGGLMYYLCERIPKVGEKTAYKGMEIAVHSVRNGRIHKLRVRRS